jgi:hypothetical protein
MSNQNQGGCANSTPNALALVGGTGPNSGCLPAPPLSHLTFTNLPSNAAGIFAANVSQSTVTALQSSDANTFPAGSTAVITCNYGAEWQCE